MDERIIELRAELREDPTSRLFYQLGELLRREEAHEEAVRVLRAGLAHHPRYVAAWVALGRSLSTLERHAEAEEACAEALELDPENAVAARMIGESAAARGDLARAVKALELARVLAPRDPDLEELIAEVETGLSRERPLRQPTEAEGLSGPPPTSGRPPGGLTTIPARHLELPELELAEVGEGDPFQFAGGDTGVWMLGDDVFATPEPEPEPELAMADETAESVEVAETASAGQEPVEEAPEPGGAASPEWEFEEAPVTPGRFGPVEADDRGREDWEVEGLEGGVEPPPEESPGWDVATPVIWARSVPPAEPAGEAAGEPEALEDLEADDGREFEPPEDVAAAEPVAVRDEGAPVEGESLSGTLAEEAPLEVDPGELSEPETMPRPGEEEEWAEVEEVPLPTLTLARLAYEQGDLRLAERTLLGVLERQPSSEEARSLLERIRGQGAPPTGPEVEEEAPAAAAVGQGVSPAVAKIAALRAWADAIRLAAEQRSP